MAPDVEAPLLAASSKPATAAAASLPRRNKYPFFCAVLASMTSVLMGYSTHAHHRSHRRLASPRARRRRRH